MTDARQLRELCRGLSALYVEDEAEIRAHMEGILGNFFEDLRLATDGAEGLERYRQRPADLVITDIMMPGMDGLAMAAAIKEIDPLQRLLIVSAYNEPRFFAQAIRVGVDGFVLKPVELQQLLDALRKTVLSIREHLENRAYHHELERLVEEKSAELAHQAITDPLTGLYNMTKLQQALERDEPCGLLLLNPENMGRINSAYGLDIGNWVLQSLAAFLRDQLPAGSELYRLTCAEFVITLPGADAETTDRVAESVRGAMGNYCFTLRHGCIIRMNVTMALSHGRGPELLRRARLALQEVRQRGGNRIGRFQPDSPMETHQRETLDWIGRLRTALDEGRLTAWFQPVVNNATGRIEKYECLARVREGDEIIPPIRFLEAAKLGGLMPRLTEAVVMSAVRAMEGNTDCQFSINITDDDLSEGRLTELMASLVERGRVSPSRVVFEILEGISVQGADEAVERIRELKAMGFQIAIDDFGAEHSHFARILDLRADLLKIDGRFIRAIDHDAQSLTICRAITQMARGMGLKVVAEFVHSEAVQRIVQELGIDYSQGYHFGAPAELPDHHR